MNVADGTQPENAVEASLRLVARSFSAVGHELAGPIQTALNALFVLERKKAPSPAELTTSLHAIEAAVETLRARLDRLLRLPQALHATRRRTTVGEVVDLALGPLAERAGRVRVIAGREASLSIDADAAALALRELLLNALEAAPPEATVSLSAGLEAEAFVARISNPGRGFPLGPEAALDPFYSLHGKMLGLGLPVARAVGLAHGGGLHLADEAGTSVVTLTLAGARS